MVPRAPPELVARLAGLVLVGVCIGNSLRLAVDLICFVEWPAAPAGLSAGGVLAWTLRVAESVTLTGALRLLTGGLPVLGLLAGLYFLFGGVWPLRRLVLREVRRG